MNQVLRSGSTGALIFARSTENFASPYRHEVGVRRALEQELDGRVPGDQAVLVALARAEEPAAPSGRSAPCCLLGTRL
jgi:hypothetical protein